MEGRLARARAERDEAAPPEGELLDHPIEVSGEPEGVDQRHRVVVERRAAGSDQIGGEPPPRPGVRGYAQVVADSEAVEELERLERAGQPALGAPSRRPGPDGAAVELDRAPGGGREAGDGIDSGRLAGPVRADQTNDVAWADLERQPVDRPDASEADGEVAYVEPGRPYGRHRRGDGGGSLLGGTGIDRPKAGADACGEAPGDTVGRAYDHDDGQ